MSDNRSLIQKGWDALTKASCPNPKCRKSGGKETDKEFIESENFVETELQEEKHYDKDNNFTGATQRKVQVLKQFHAIHAALRSCEECV